MFLLRLFPSDEATSAAYEKVLQLNETCWASPLGCDIIVSASFVLHDRF